MERKEEVMKSPKRVLSLLLSLVLMLSCIPTVALAEETPALPTAAFTDLQNEDFTFAVNFLNDTPSTEQSNYYGSWQAEFEVSFSKPITLNADGTADGYVGFQMDYFGVDWINLPVESVTLAAGQPLNVMESLMASMGASGSVAYYDIRDAFFNLNLGVKLSDEYLAANPNVMTTIAIKLTNPETNEVVVLAKYVNGVPEYPTATVTPIMQEGMTFAMNFLMDEPSEEQLTYYGDWFADFEITINKDVVFDANGTGDGWLAGQYDEWSPNWVNVPIEPVTIKAGETLKIMEFAAELLGQSGLKLTYAEVYESVKDFDCSVFFDEEFLVANPDVEVTLELKMYSPDGAKSSVIGETLDFTYNPETPDLPTATVTDTENDDLTFSMNFKVDEATLSQQAYYGKWYADFELTVNKTVVFNNDGSADGWLAGQYDAWSENWVTVPFGNYAPVTLKAGDTLRIMEFAAELMGEPGLKYTFQEVYDFVKDFDCGVYFDTEFLAANPDLEVTLELKMYNPADETESYVIGETYTFINNFVAQNTATEKLYTTVNDAMLDGAAGETVVLLKDVTETIVYVLTDTTLDLNGKTLTADYVSCFGDLVDNSADNAGVLVVPTKQFMIREDNSQLPVHDGTGYRFVEVQRIATAMASEYKFAFQPRIEPAMLDLLEQGADVTGVTIQVLVSWKQGNGERTQKFVYNDSHVQEYLDSYKASTDEYGNMFTLTLNGAENFEELTFTAQIVSTNNVTFSS